MGDSSDERAGLINRRDWADCLKREGLIPLSPTNSEFSKAVEVRHSASNGLLTPLAKPIRTDSSIWLERAAHNGVVPGSSPGRSTKYARLVQRPEHPFRKREIKARFLG